ncbi:MAG: glycosyltransferase family 2 protein [Lachnospiraceae bacterium]|nr:glycosyltransferase family 2 protein [Lachnospiraceae bacterium]
MKTTIVIPNYNGCKLLEACLESLQAGTVQAPVLVVDNGSTDGSVDFLKKITASDPLIEALYLDHNTGFAPAVNEGIRASITEYVLLLNNDTEVDAHFVEEMERALDGHPDAFSVSARMMQYQDKSRIDDAGDYYTVLGYARARGKGKIYKEQGLYSRECRIFSACGGAAIYRRSVLEEVGLFDEAHFAYLEDLDLGYRGILAGYHNYYAPRAVVYHVGSASTGSRYNAFKVQISARNNIYLTLKNQPLLQWLINAPFLLIGCLIKCLFFARKGLAGQYVKGLGEGFALGFSKEGRQKHVGFRFSRFFRYILIEIELILNVLRMIL